MAVSLPPARPVLVTLHNRSRLCHGAFKNLVRPHRIARSEYQGQRSDIFDPRRFSLTRGTRSKSELDDAILYACDVARRAPGRMFILYHDSSCDAIHSDKKRAVVAWTTERKGIDGIAKFRIKRLRLIECGKHRSASNSSTGVVHREPSQLSGRQSRPSYNIALAIEGKKDASSGAP